MPKRLIFGREDAPNADATIETRDRGKPKAREIKSDETQMKTITGMVPIRL
jgi:hypothetical protein